MIAEAKFHDNFGAMDPKFGKQPAELGNFQELLDSPHVPDAHNSPSGGSSTRTVVWIETAPIMRQWRFSKMLLETGNAARLAQ